MSNEVWKALQEVQHSECGVDIEGQFISLHSLVQLVNGFPVAGARRVLIKAPVSKAALVTYLSCMKENCQVLWVDIEVDESFVESFPYDLMYYEAEGVGPEYLCTRAGDFKEAKIDCFPSVGFLTSGTTGQSKVIYQSMSSVYAFAHESIGRLGIDNETRCLIRASAAWDIFIIELFSVLLAGGKAYVLPRFIANNPIALSGVVSGKGINFLQMTPSYFDLLTYSTQGQGYEAVKTIVLTGETLFARHRIAQQFPATRFLTVYGACELHNVFSMDVTEQLQCDVFLPAGEKWHVVDSLARVDLADGFFHVAVKSCNVMQGYSQAGQYFDCIQPYHNLDIFEWRAGNYYYCGRLDSRLGLQLSVWLHKLKCRANYWCDQILQVVAINVFLVDDRPRFVVSSAAEADALRLNMAAVLEGAPFSIDEVQIDIVKVVPKTIHGKVDGKQLIAQLN